MKNICVRVPKRLQEGLETTAQQLNVKVSDLIREALWACLHGEESKKPSSFDRKASNFYQNQDLEEQIYLIRSLVERFVLSIAGGGEDFVAKSHQYKEKLLNNARSQNNVE